MFTEPQAIVKLKAAIAEVLPNAEVSVDQPALAYGGWFVDIKLDKVWVVVQYRSMREDNKFQVSLITDKVFFEVSLGLDQNFGTRPGEVEVRSKVPDVVALVASMLEGRWEPQQV